MTAIPRVRVDETIIAEIIGEVEKDFLESPQIEVEQVTVLHDIPGHLPKGI